MRSLVVFAAVNAMSLRQGLAQAVPPDSEQRVDYSRALETLRHQIPAAMEQAHIPGLAIALVDGDRLVWGQGFWFTDRSKTVPATEQTLFLVQSISKTYKANGGLLALGKDWVTL